MCSANWPTDSGIDPHAALEAAVARVAEDSFYACVEPLGTDWRASLAGTVWVEARVAFHGAGDGLVICQLPQALARDCACAFLGVGDDELTAAIVDDLAGELANQMCGCWLTRAFPSQLFHLGRPQVRYVTEPPPDSWLLTAINGAPFAVSVSLHEA